MQFANLVDSGVCKKLLSSNFHVRFNKTASTLEILSTAFISFHFYELKWYVCRPQIECVSIFHSIAQAQAQGIEHFR